MTIVGKCCGALPSVQQAGSIVTGPTKATSVKQPRRAPASNRAATDDAEARLPIIARTIHLFEGKVRHTRSILFNLLLIGAIAIVIPIIVSELFGARVTIEPIAVPPAMESVGLSGTVVANRLWDSWSELTSEVAISKETQNVMPSSQRIEFSIPDSGVSFESLIHHIRAFFGRAETRISGEMVCEAEPCTRQTIALRLRVVNTRTHVIQLAAIGAEPEADYYRRAVAEVLLITDPVRGIMALRDNDQERAIAELRRLVRDRHPDAEWALTYAGILLTNRGDYAAARASFDQALAMHPRFAMALINRAAAEAAAGDLDTAMQTINQAIAISPGDGRAFMRKAEIEVRQSATSQALESYRTAAKLLPNAPEPVFSLATILYRAGRPDEARQAYAAALEIDPNYVEARNGLALLALLDQDFAEMARQYGEIIRLRPADAEAYGQLAYALSASGRPADSVAAYRQAVALAPANATLARGLGTALRSNDETAAALAAFEAASRLDPALPGIWFDIGDALLALDRPIEAQTAFERYLTLEPNGTMANFARSHLQQDAKP
jgi:tetratricopeptide (TPR) repeat protein